jgi:hypothetical protein
MSARLGPSDSLAGSLASATAEFDRIALEKRRVLTNAFALFGGSCPSRRRFEISPPERKAPALIGAILVYAAAISLEKHAGAVSRRLEKRVSIAHATKVPATEVVEGDAEARRESRDLTLAHPDVPVGAAAAATAARALEA